MDEELAYYAAPGPRSDLRAHRLLLNDLPEDAVQLGEIVRGLLVHNTNGALRALDLSPQRMADMQLASAEAVVDAVLVLDASPLDHVRPLDRRMVGFCYHFALLHCALLRAKGIPSRARCGFASYFHSNRWIDHWVIEYWDGERWILYDSQLGRGDLQDVDFQNGLQAWERCRNNAAEPMHYGNEVFWGWDELRGSLINDVGALHKVEVGGWAWCELIAVEPNDQPHAALDTRLDELIAHAEVDDSYLGLRHAFENDTAVQPPTGVGND